MSFSDRVRRVPAAAWALLFAVALLLPGLGRSGFWDPWELTLADRVRELASSGSLGDSTVHGRFAAEPPLDLLLSALGVKLFGAREFGARLGYALFGIAALFGVYWSGAGMFRRRAGLLAALALGTMPLFFLQGRQLVSDMPLVAGLTFAFGGLGRYAWPASGRRCLTDLGVAVAGIIVGSLSGGFLLGAALPCLSIAAALLVGWRLRPGDKPTPDQLEPDAGDPRVPLTAAGVGPDLPEGQPLGPTLLGGKVNGRVALVAVVLVGIGLLIATLASATVAGRYSMLLGGSPRGGVPSQSFEYLIRQIGFGIFPWSALAVFAVGRGVVRLMEEGDGAGRLAFQQSYLLIAAAFGFALSGLYVILVGDARFCALAPLALAIGALLDEGLQGERSEPVLGLLAAMGTLVVARDIALEPEELVSQHLLAKVKWPPTYSVGNALLLVGAVVGLGVYATLAVRRRANPVGAPTGRGRAAALAHKASTLAAIAGRWGITAALAAAVLFAFGVIHSVVPSLSHHYSFKPVFESFARYAKPGDPIGRYRVEGHGASFYGSTDMVELPTQERLVEFLKPARHAFALVSTDDLAALDAAFKTANVPYFVADASSSRFLLLTNQVASPDADVNPLRRNVWMAPQLPTERPATPGAARSYDWHGAKPPWDWVVPLSVVWEDSIELVGATFPSSIRRPGKLTMTLTFRVMKRPPGAYKIFAHWDAPGQPRLLGDHVPLNGAFPTSYWLPGEYIRDEYEIDVPLMTQPAGTYSLYLGFWPGGEGKRMRITSGPNDGGDRALVGSVSIR